MPRPATGLNTVSRRRRDGSLDYTWYHRTTGLLIGRSRDGWTKDQAAERAAQIDAEAPKAGPPAGSFGELAALFLASPAFARLAPRTKQEYEDHLDLMTAMWRDVPIAGITKRAVKALHAQFADRPWRGNSIIRTLRLVMNYAIDDLEMPGVVKNPARKIGLYATAPRSTLWDQRRIDAFLAAAADAPRIRRAFAILLYTVQRPGDVLKMGAPMLTEREGRTWIRLRQAKTGEWMDVPCHARLAAELAQPLPASADKRGIQSILLVSSPRGVAWRYRNFARAWDAVRTRANWALAREALRRRGGLPGPGKPKERAAVKAQVRAEMLHDVQRRDLRRTGIVQMAIAGATTAQIAAISGHRIEATQKILDTYLPRRGEVALGGIEKWEAGGGNVVTLADRRR